MDVTISEFKEAMYRIYVRSGTQPAIARIVVDLPSQALPEKVRSLAVTCFTKQVPEDEDTDLVRTYLRTLKTSDMVTFK